MVARVLIVTRSTVVLHVCCDTVSLAVGFWIFAPFFSLVALLPCNIAPCVVVVVCGSHWSIIAAIKAVIWAVWESAAEEKVLSSSEMSDVDAVAREGG